MKNSIWLVHTLNNRVLFLECCAMLLAKIHPAKPVRVSKNLPKSIDGEAAELNAALDTSVLPGG